VNQVPEFYSDKMFE